MGFFAEENWTYIGGNSKGQASTRGQSIRSIGGSMYLTTHAVIQLRLFLYKMEFC